MMHPLSLSVVILATTLASIHLVVPPQQKENSVDPELKEKAP